MAEKKFGLGTALLIGAAAAAVAGGVASYIKRAEIKRLAEEIMTRVKPADDADGEIGDWDIRPGMATEEAHAAPEDVNIVDSGLSLESVESPAEDTAEEEPAGETENEPAGEAQPESGTDAAGQPEAEADTGAEEPEAAPESEAEQPKKKTWFWSK